MSTTQTATLGEPAASIPRGAVRPVVYSLFFISGGMGLVYEVVWLRSLALIFGNTTLATSTCLAVFMGGLALGSYVFGRMADRHRNPLRLYGWLELGTGFWCALSPTLLHGVQKAYVAIYTSLPAGSAVGVAIQFLLCCLVLIVPTSLMGGTLPVVVKVVTERFEHTTASVGILYAGHTFGAVAGCAAAGFFLLPAMGLSRTVYAAAVVNTVIGLVMFFLSRAPRVVRARPLERVAESPPGEARGRLLHVLLVAFGLSGFAALALEVAWARTLCMAWGSSVYGFTTLLTCYLAGLALGSLLFAKLYADRAIGPAWFAGCELIIGSTSLALTYLFGLLPHAFTYIVSGFRESMSALMGVDFVVCMALLAVPTLFMGANFPIVARICSSNLAELGQGVGRVYAANTVGAIAGAFLAGFVLIPGIGLRGTLLLASGLYLLIGCGVLLISYELRASRGWWAAAFALAGAAGALLVPDWSRIAMSSAVFLKGALLDPANAEVKFYQEGSTCTVSVTRDTLRDMISLRVNGKVDASTGISDMYTQLLLGHLPMMIADNPKRGLVIGLGSGVTAGAALSHGLERLDCVEIEPAVARAARLFAPWNRGVLEEPRFQLIAADGRSHALASRNRYDVIISEPSNPWIAGVSSLFTVEHFRACRAALRPGGVMCQWLQTYSLSRSDLKMVMRSFLEVFPEATVWYSTASDLLLIGGEGLQRPDYHGWGKRIADRQVLQEALRSVEVYSAGGLSASLLLDNAAARKFVAGASLNTDDLPSLEFSAPRSLYVNTEASNLEALSKLRPPVGSALDGIPRRGHAEAAFHFDAGKALAYKAEVAGGYESEYALAIEEFKKAILLEPGWEDAHLELARTYEKSNQVLKAWHSLQLALMVSPNSARAHYAMGRLYEWQEMPEEAVRFYRRAAELEPREKKYGEARDRLARELSQPTPGSAPGA